MDFKTKETITFKEFKHWITGLIQGKGGALPDLDDWEMIKKMMDKVEVPEERSNQKPAFPFPTIPPPPCDPCEYYRWSDGTNTVGGSPVDGSTLSANNLLGGTQPFTQPFPGEGSLKDDHQINNWVNGYGAFAEKHPSIYEAYSLMEKDYGKEEK